MAKEGQPFDAQRESLEIANAAYRGKINKYSVVEGYAYLNSGMPEMEKDPSGITEAEVLLRIPELIEARLKEGKTVVITDGTHARVVALFPPGKRNTRYGLYEVNRLNWGEGRYQGPDSITKPRIKASFVEVVSEETGTKRKAFVLKIGYKKTNGSKTNGDNGIEFTTIASDGNYPGEFTIMSEGEEVLFGKIDGTGSFGCSREYDKASRWIVADVAKPEEKA